MFEVSNTAMTISGRAYRHTATYYAYSCSVDWQGVVMARRDLPDEDTVFARINLPQSK